VDDEVGPFARWWEPLLTGGPTMTRDLEIKQAVLRELEWDPRIGEARIGVEVESLRSGSIRRSPTAW
jgi:hypothetical protein